MTYSAAITHAATALVALTLFSGCRTYGGHGSEEATYEQIKQAVAVFEEDLGRARGELSAVQGAMGADSAKAELVDHFSRIVAAHERQVESQTGLVDRLSAHSGYRELNRVFGALVVNQQNIRNQYARLLRNAYRAPEDATMARSANRPYSLIPPYYNRVAESRRTPGLSEILARERNADLDTAADDTARPVPTDTTAARLD